MSKVAVFGGTFNPFHIGHYEMLKCLCDLNFIDKVLLLPDKIPPHKVCDYMPLDKHRIEMCDIICKEFSKAELCLVDFEREGKSYTVDTIKSLKEKYPNDDFYFVVGGDMLSTLDKWYNYKELIRETSFIAFERESVEGFEEELQKYKNMGADIVPVFVDIPDVSSTDFRNNPDKSLLPQKIYDYITEKGIYNVK